MEIVWEYVGLQGVKKQCVVRMITFWVLSAFLPVFVLAVTIESLSASEVSGVPTCDWHYWEFAHAGIERVLFVCTFRSISTP